MERNKFLPLQSKLNDILVQEDQTRHAQLVVIERGEMVVNLAGSSPGLYEIDSTTPFLTFSVSKAFTAAAIFHLIDQGKIELDEPVSRYWKEFGVNGKESATIRHVLLHQAGVPAPNLYRQVVMWPSWNLVTRNLARTPAQFTPGTETAYHLVNFGFILGEVVRRVSGLPIDQYLQKEFFAPLGFRNTWMRIPGNQLTRSPRVFAASKTMQNTAALFNLPFIRRALIPAAGLHSTAIELALFFQMLLSGGELNGRRYLQSETIEMATQSQYDGYDSYVKYHMNWGFGFIIGGGKVKPDDLTRQALGWGSSSTTFSAFGMGTCMVWADYQSELITAFTCDGMLADADVNQRWASISNAVWDCVRNPL